MNNKFTDNVVFNSDNTEGQFPDMEDVEKALMREKGEFNESEKLRSHNESQHSGWLLSSTPQEAVKVTYEAVDRVLNKQDNQQKDNPGQVSKTINEVARTVGKVVDLHNQLLKGNLLKELTRRTAATVAYNNSFNSTDTTKEYVTSI